MSKSQFWVVLLMSRLTICWCGTGTSEKFEKKFMHVCVFVGLYIYMYGPDT